MQEESPLVSVELSGGLLKPQFNTRGLFFLTVIVAVAAAMLAPFLRGWSSTQRLWFVGIFLFEFLLLTALLIVTVYQRRSIVRQLGERTYRTSFRDDHRKGSWRELKALLPIVLQIAFVLGLATWVIQTERYRNLMIVCVYVFQSFIAVSRSFAMLWGIDDRDIEIGSNGFIWGGFGWTPWNVVQEIRPTEKYVDRIAMVFQKPGASLNSTSTIRVAEGTREQILGRMKEQRERWYQQEETSA